MDFANFWLPIIGGGIFWSIAASAWFADYKIVGIWFGFAGSVCLALLFALQIQQSISRTPLGAPKIRVRGITILTPNGGSIWDPVDVLYSIENMGRAAAHITQRNVAVHIMNPGLPPKGAPGFDYETEDRSPVDIEAGKAITRQYTSKLHLTWEQQQAVRTGQLALLFNGYVNYSDGAGIPTQVFFLQRWDYGAERFFTMQDPDYERPDPH